MGPAGVVPVGHRSARPTMSYPIELPDDLRERLEVHLDDDETLVEFIEELLNVYESSGTFLQEGYSE